jgi:hypothetical protein
MIYDDEEYNVAPLGYGNVHSLGSTFLPSIVNKNPLAVAAEKEPKPVIDLVKEMTKTRQIEARLANLNKMSGDHSTITVNWLHTRQPGEKRINITTGGRSGFFGIFGRKTECGYLKTKVEIS